MSSKSREKESQERQARQRAAADARAERAVERSEQSSRRAAERAERAAERAAEKVEQATERAAREVERARQQVERGRDMAGEALIWFRDEPAARRPAHSRADIARAAIEIADAEGFDAVSMRRVAQRLGAGTMTLYHYVRNKDELITLMGDAVMGEILVPDGELSGDWRTAMTQIAHRTRGVFARHRWIFDRFGEGGPSPNMMRHFEQSLAAVAPLELDRDETFDLIGQLDDYVFGFALREVHEREEHERGWPPEVVDYLQRELDTGDYPLISRFLGDDARAGIEETLTLINSETRFERGLKRLLDGIEANLPPRS